MKQFILLIAIFLKVFFAFAQQGMIDNLRYKLSVATNDTAKAVTLDSLSMYYLFFTNKPDSSFFYANEFINHSFNLKNKKYLILAYAHMGFYYLNSSQYKAALNISLKGLKLSKQYHIVDCLSALYYNISWVYFNLGDPVSAQKNAFEGMHNIKDSWDPFYDEQLHLLGLIGNMYLNYNKLDSANYYFKLVDSLAPISKELAAKDIAIWYRSMYYLNKEDYPMADSLILQGIASCERNGNFLLDFFLSFLAESYLKQGKVNEAILAGRRALDVSNSIEDNGGAYSAAYLLQTCYDKLGNRDSAYKYLRMSDSLHSLTLSKGSLNEIQQVKFDEQLSQKEEETNRMLQNEKTRNKIKIYVVLTALFSFLVITIIQWSNNKQKKKANTLLQQQKEKIEHTLSELKSTQSQLIQSEKMASLGELTAGIAHEIQNPLNFVNNFSEVNKEMLEELKAERLKPKAARDENLEDDILNDVIANEEKINHHGKRAAAIVKGMLQQSRSSSGQKEPTNINKLADEYLRLSYQGFRAKDKTFNATLRTDYDESIGDINLIPQDIGRVLLNLFNNAFYAVNEKQKAESSKQNTDYKPLISVQTKKAGNIVEITVSDNGSGIPQKIVDKIFQPFFTTKPTGQGTGLGLSLSYDIIKAHGGEIKVETKEGNGCEFIIQLPLN